MNAVMIFELHKEIIIASLPIKINRVYEFINTNEANEQSINKLYK